MAKINWILRLKNKATLTTLVAILIAAIYQLLGLFDIVPAIAQEDVIQLAGLVITFLAALGIVIDPTTAGISDSNRAMDYTEPRQDNKDE